MLPKLSTNAPPTSNLEVNTSIFTVNTFTSSCLLSWATDSSVPHTEEQRGSHVFFLFAVTGHGSLYFSSYRYWYIHIYWYTHIHIFVYHILFAFIFVFIITGISLWAPRPDGRLSAPSKYLFVNLTPFSPIFSFVFTFTFIVVYIYIYIYIFLAITEVQIVYW